MTTAPSRVTPNTCWNGALLHVSVHAFFSPSQRPLQDTQAAFWNSTGRRGQESKPLALELDLQAPKRSACPICRLCTC